jgi:hypothetical protein
MMLSALFTGEQKSNWYHGAAMGMTSTLTILIILAALYYFASSFIINPTMEQPSLDTLFEACTVFSRDLLKLEKVDTDVLHKIDQVCYDHVHWRGLLNDFSVRRSKVIQQNSEDIILLWMVVAITISGVILAGLQLLGSYRLASVGKGDFAQSGEMSFESRGNISLKTSVTGLLILTSSFAFFLVYVIWVYPIQGVQVDPDVPQRGANVGGSTMPIPNLTSGGVGRPVATTK